MATIQHFDRLLLFMDGAILLLFAQQAIISIHGFIQNLYNYASTDTEAYRTHLLCDTLLIPRLVLPYLDKCVREAATTTTDPSEILPQGIASSLRTLVRLVPYCMCAYMRLLISHSVR